MSSGLKNNKYGKIVVTLVLASLFLSTSAFAQNGGNGNDPFTTYTVRNKEELHSVLEIKGVPHKRIVFIDNVLVGMIARSAPATYPMIFTIQEGDTVEIYLDRYNFQGNTPAIFEGGEGSRLRIQGSTTAFNGGFDLRGKIALTYEGIYTMSGTDDFGGAIGDNVRVYLTTPGSKWLGATSPGAYMTKLETDSTDRTVGRNGTIVIGDRGEATMYVGTTEVGGLPIIVRNSETVLGAQRGTDILGIGTLTLKGGTVDWFTSGSFYVGYWGEGTLEILNGINLSTGSIVVGVEDGSEGKLYIDGQGTVVNLYGRSEYNYITPTHGIMTAEGNGVMHLTDGALLNFDDSTVPLLLSAPPSGYVPKLGLGIGDSVVDNATIRGARMTCPVTKDILFGPAGVVAGQDTITIYDQAGWIVGTEDGTLFGTLNDNSLTFLNNAVLEGSLNIAMNTITFGNGVDSGAFLMPGEGTYGSDVVFGRINFITSDSTFDHKKDARTYIKFSVHGDMNFLPGDPRVQEGGVYEVEGAYLGDRGRDVISITGGTAKLDGHIHFRPQSGYYTKDRIEVHFMELLDGATFDGQYKSLSIYPNRWFVFSDDPEVSLDQRPTGNYLMIGHEATPFTNVANSNNTRSVAGVLEDIYNAQTNREWLAVLDWLWTMDDDTFRRAMQQLAGETRASSFFMPTRSPWRLVFDRMDANEVAQFRHQQQQRELQRQQPDCRSACTFRGSSARTSTRAQNGVWASPFYDYLRARDDGNVSAASNSRIGFIAGYDRALTNRSSLGAVFLYSHPRMTQEYSRVTADEYLVGVHYNTLFQDRFELRFWGSYGAQVYNMKRNIPLRHADGRLQSKYTGNTVALSSQIALPLQWRDFIFRPHAGLDLNYVQQNGTLERGFDAIRLHYYSADWTQLFGRVGMKTEYSHKRWDLSGTLGYSFMFAGDTMPTVRNRFYTDGPAFDIEGNDLGRHFVSLGLGARRWLNDKNTRMLFLQYSGEYGRNSNVQTAMLGCQFMF